MASSVIGCTVAIVVTSIGSCALFRFFRLLTCTPHTHAGQDDRTTRLMETLLGMEVIKFFAMEEAELGAVQDLRLRELSWAKKRAFLKAGHKFFNQNVAPLIILAVLSAYVAGGGVLTAGNLFGGIAVMNILRRPLKVPFLCGLAAILQGRGGEMPWSGLLPGSLLSFPLLGPKSPQLKKKSHPRAHTQPAIRRCDT